MIGTPSDEQLMDRVRRGERPALEALVRRYATPLLSLLSRMDPDEAEDLFQETWIAVWMRSGTFDTRRRFKPWLYRIAINRTRDAQRRKRPWSSDTLDARPSGEGAEGETRAMREERVAAAGTAIERLPDSQRAVVALRLYASLGYAEIADALRVTESTARSHMSLALRALREELAPLGDLSEPEEANHDRSRSRK